MYKHSSGTNRDLLCPLAELKRQTPKILLQSYLDKNSVVSEHILIRTINLIWCNVTVIIVAVVWFIVIIHSVKAIYNHLYLPPSWNVFYRSCCKVNLGCVFCRPVILLHLTSWPMPTWSCYVTGKLEWLVVLGVFSRHLLSLPKDI